MSDTSRLGLPTMGDHDDAERLEQAYGSRFAALHRHESPEWPYAEAESLRTDVESLIKNMDGLDILPTLRVLSTMQERMGNIAGDVIEIAAKETNLTQKAVAEAIGLAPSALKGWRG